MAVSGRDDDPTSSGDQQTSSWSFADRLDELFRTVLNPDSGKQFSVRHVAHACGLSHTHLNKLRSGLANDPRWSEMEALARFFDVPLDYFVTQTPTDVGATIIDGYHTEHGTVARRPVVSQIALRMIEQRLSPEGVAAVVAIIDEVARLEAAQRRPVPDNGGGSS